MAPMMLANSGNHRTYSRREVIAVFCKRYNPITTTSTNKNTQLHLILWRCNVLLRVFDAPTKLESYHYSRVLSSNDCGFQRFGAPFDFFVASCTSSFTVDVSSCYDSVAQNGTLSFEEEVLLLRLLLMWKRRPVLL